MINAPPSRAPVALLHVLAHSLFVGKDVVDLRPQADSDACYAHTAKSLLAVHTAMPRPCPTNSLCNASTSCEDYQTHIRQQHGHTRYSAVCSDFRSTRVVPDGDYYIWWQRQPYWANGLIVGLLRDAQAHGQIRSSARAVIMYDLTMWRDAADWQTAQLSAIWHETVAFDEREACLRQPWPDHPEKYRPLCRAVEPGSKAVGGRACGMWAAAVYPLDTVEIWPLVNGTEPCPFGGGRRCVSGRLPDASPECRVGQGEVQTREVRSRT